MRRTALGALAAALVATLAGCATEAPSQAAAPPSPPPVTPIPPEPAPPPAPADTCGASALSALVGRPRTEIPIPTDLTRRRVVCTACPMTQDFRPDRQTILYDATTNLVTAVRCG